MIVWFALTLISLLLRIIDLASNSPVSRVRKLGWLLVVAYTGPVGFVAFLFASRRPFPGGRDRFTRATWKQGIDSEVHCLAGGATGILVANLQGWRWVVIMTITRWQGFLSPSPPRGWSGRSSCWSS